MAKKAGDRKLYRNEGVAELVFKKDDGTDEICEPGSEFHASLTPEHESQLLAGGHISIVQDQSRKADVAQAEAAGESVEGEKASGGKKQK